MVGMNNEIIKDVEGKSLGLIETLCRNFPEATEENKQKPQPA
jgi:hypothetical protein